MFKWKKLAPMKNSTKLKKDKYILRVYAFIASIIYNPYIVFVVLSYLLVLLIKLVSFTIIGHAEECYISEFEVSYYLKLASYDYNVFKTTEFTLPEEIYYGWCDKDIFVTQRSDAYCLNLDVIRDHVSGVKPSPECCSF